MFKDVLKPKQNEIFRFAFAVVSVVVLMIIVSVARDLSRWL